MISIKNKQYSIQLVKNIFKIASILFQNQLNLWKKALLLFGTFYTILQIFLLPKVQVLPASHFPLYFHCPFDSQQMLQESKSTFKVFISVRIR